MIGKDMESIYVTRPSLPPLEEFVEYLSQIWDSRILTNNGPFHQQFEKELADYLGVKFLSVFANGTLALVTALQALRIGGEVITTPFSFVATTHSLWWNNIKPVFVDIEPDYFTIDPEKIEAAITPQTMAIMPVHVYGNPCNLDAIQKIADTYGLKVIYDAAQAFGVKIKGKTILSFGNLSILSFHATKTFNTIEGGAIVCHEELTKKRIDHLKNFGFEDEVTVIEPGINAKMNELQAAYGILQLHQIDNCISARKYVFEKYLELLTTIEGIIIPDLPKNTTMNYGYFPILIDSAKKGETRDQLYQRLRSRGIYSRRYFYPLISEFPPYNKLDSSNRDNLPVSYRIASQVLCLPIYADLRHDTVSEICNCIVNKKR